MPFASPNDFHQLAEFFEANLFQGQNNTRRRVQVLDEWSVDEIHRTFLKEKTGHEDRQGYPRYSFCFAYYSTVLVFNWCRVNFQLLVR